MGKEVNGQPWIEKYQPQKIRDLVGNKKAVTSIKDWLANWPKSISRNKRALLLYGPPGVGKTIAVHVIAKHLGFDVSEINSSVKRSKKAMNELLKTSTFTGSLMSQRGRIVFIDELAGLSGKADRGAASAIREYIPKSRVPIILATTDISNQKIRPLLRLSQTIEFHQIEPPDLVQLLIRICQNENIEYEQDALEELASTARGDIRAAVNDLQNVVKAGKALTKENMQRILKWRDQTLGINEVLDRIFYAETWTKAVSIANQTDIYPDELLRWVVTNISLVFRDNTQLVNAFQWLSRASIFSNRIKRTQNWKLLPYSKELMCINRSLTQGEPALIHPDYQFPEWIQKMGFSRSVRQKRRNVGELLAPVVHMSSKKAYREHILLLRSLLRNKKVRKTIINDLELSDELVDFILRAKTE